VADLNGRSAFVRWVQVTYSVVERVLIIVPHRRNFSYYDCQIEVSSDIWRAFISIPHVYIFKAFESC